MAGAMVFKAYTDRDGITAAVIAYKRIEHVSQHGIGRMH